MPQKSTILWPHPIPCHVGQGLKNCAPENTLWEDASNMHLIMWEDMAWVTKPAPCLLYFVGQGNLKHLYNVVRYFHLFAFLKCPSIISSVWGRSHDLPQRTHYTSICTILWPALPLISYWARQFGGLKTVYQRTYCGKIPQICTLLCGTTWPVLPNLPHGCRVKHGRDLHNVG